MSHIQRQTSYHLSHIWNVDSKKASFEQKGESSGRAKGIAEGSRGQEKVMERKNASKLFYMNV